MFARAGQVEMFCVWPVHNQQLERVEVVGHHISGETYKGARRGTTSFSQSHW
jgi:hypothetical protein